MSSIYPYPTHTPCSYPTHTYSDPQWTFKPPVGEITVGTCSLCGGMVTVPQVWFGVIPPTPTCTRCGAMATPPELPVIPMSNPRRAAGVSWPQR